jgi:glycosyltransferase involved in cell wall biosynthesis
MIKICFLLLNAYPILANTKIHEFAGGAEVEYVYLGRELVNLGYDVCFITYKEKGCEIPEIERIGDIEIIKTYPKYQASTLNTLVKVRHILKALRKADGDIYFGHGSSGILTLYSLLCNKKFIFRISSDVIAMGGSYFSSNTRLLRYYFESLANRVELKKATIVVAQTERQKKLLAKKGIKSMVIRNGFVMKPPFNFKNEKTHPPTVLWVGALSYIKQPQLFLKLAKLLPEAQFEMIGPKLEEELQLFKFVEQESKKMPNFKYRGFVPLSEVDVFYKKASILVNTSIYEGFPMSFIQAWLNYTPIVSLNVDPDGIIERERIGFYSKTFDRLVQDVHLLITDEKLREEMGWHARKYAEREFDIRVIARKYANVFEKIIKI